MKIGVVGLGTMGGGMARSLLFAGHEVFGYDVSDSALSAFGDLGGHAVHSASDAVRGCDALVVMVVNGEQVNEVLFGTGAAAQSASPGTLFILSSTIAPALATDFGARLEERGFLVLDAPVSGGKIRADKGELSVFAAGSSQAFEKAEPILEAVSLKVHRLGAKLGMGSTYKVVHQLAAGIHIAVAGELLALGARAGCDTRTLFEIMRTSAGNSWMLEDRGPRMIDRDFNARSAVDIFVKDLDLVLDLGREKQMSLPLATVASQMFRAASYAGLGKLDDSAIVQIYEKL